MATDNGSCFDAVFKAVLPGVPRILCLHHIGENIKSHLKAKLKGQWITFRNNWWRLVLDPADEAAFDLEWDKLVTMYPASRNYLTQYIHPDRRLWCRVWTRRYVTFGALTTQRSESVNSALKHFIKRNSNLETLFKHILAIVQRWTDVRDDSIERSQHTNHPTAGPVYNAAVRHLTREAALLVYTEGQYMTEYHCHLFSRPPKNCAPSIYSAASTSARAQYVPHQSFSSFHNSFTQDSNNTSSVFKMSSASPVFSQSRSSLLTVSQSSSSTSAVLAQSSDTAKGTDSYHPHATDDLPDDGPLYCVRHRVAEQAHVTHWVRVREGSASCTDCKFSTNYLLPCRHILATNVVHWPTANAFRVGQCHRRWWLEQHLLPSALPSTTAVLSPANMPITLTDALQIEYDDPARGLSSDDIFRKWTPAAAHACSFIQPHGEAGLTSLCSIRTK